MSVTSGLDRVAERLVDAAGREFDFEARTWKAAGSPLVGEPAELQDAARWMQRGTPDKIRIPVGVMGPREADEEQFRAAEGIGAGLADMGFP